MSIQTTIYNNLFKKTSTFALTIAFTAFFFERTFDMTTLAIFENYNKGKLWKHIKSNYEE